MSLGKNVCRESGSIGTGLDFAAKSSRIMQTKTREVSDVSESVVLSDEKGMELL